VVDPASDGMGHIVLAPQRLARFHLHERLVRALRQRGHRVSVVAVPPAVRTFWRHHDAAALTTLGPPAGHEVPLAEIGAAHLQDAWGRLAADCTGFWRRERPDLLLLHQDRTPGARLLQFVARAEGCRVLWTGDGLLPHTLQLDERGLDGEAACAARSAGEFRVVRGDADLLRACLTHALARSQPFALPRAAVVAPPWRERCADLWPTWRQHGLREALTSPWAWREAVAPATAAAVAWQLPAAPFVAVLLQQPDDARLVLDAPLAPGPHDLLRATMAAVRRVVPDARVVAVAAGATRRRHTAGVDVLPAAAGPDAVATALATVTVNHPLAAVALLAGTPVLHCGRALYGVRGVATRCTLGTLADDLAAALAHDHPTLRQRFLSWLFTHGHLWCSADAPDHNGMQGLVQAIETRLGEPVAPAATLRYQPGPAWPLAPRAGR